MLIFFICKQKFKVQKWSITVWKRACSAFMACYFFQSEESFGRCWISSRSLSSTTLQVHWTCLLRKNTTSWLTNDWCNWVQAEVKSSWLNPCNFRSNFSTGSSIILFHVLSSAYSPGILWWPYIHLLIRSNYLSFSEIRQSFTIYCLKRAVDNTVIRWSMFQIKKCTQEETKYPQLTESTFLDNDFTDLFPVIVLSIIVKMITVTESHA